MSPKAHRPGPAEATEAARALLAGLVRGDDLDQIAQEAYGRHPRDNTFPGEVYLHVGADALSECADRGDPIVQEGLFARHLPEAHFTGRENAKARFALLAAAATAGGLEVDLLDEVAHWSGDDYWHYALAAAVALIRAGAGRVGVPVGSFAASLAERRGVDLTGAGGERPGTFWPLL